MTDNTRKGPGPQALSAAVSAVLSMAAHDAAAQEAPETPVIGLGEVIVTATKRAERLQDVSESISAFDSDDIAMRGLTQIDDVAKYIPGLSLAQREPGGTTIVFRGVAASGIQFGAVSSSALYLDEQPITQSGRSVDPRFIDIERVEALRGPQGTLYGSSSQSGTLRVITNKPDPSGFDAWAEAQVYQVEDGDTGYDISAMLNLPLADRLALRLVGFAAEDAGYIDNVLSDSPGGTFDNADVVERGHQQHRDGRRARGAAPRRQRQRRPDAGADLPGPHRRRAQRHDARRGRPGAGALRGGELSRTSGTRPR